MRRRAVIAPIVLVAAAVLAWRRRRDRVRASLGAAPAAPAVPPPPSDSPFVSVPWTLVAAPEDGAELTIRYAVDPLLELDRVDAQETPTQVFVTVLMRPRGADGEREAAPRAREATVRLAGPLGSRALIHAPADTPAPGGGEPSGPPLYP